MLAACTVSRPPTFGEIFASAPVAQQPPLIVIPGVLGSRLSDVATGKLLWPPDILMLIGGWRVRNLELPIAGQTGAGEPEVRPSGLLLSAGDRDYYGDLLDALRDAGYRCATPSEMTADTSCVLFAWDWRKGIVAAAASLDHVIERVRAQRRDPNMKFDILADSAGGIVARYYARFGGTDVVDRPTDGSITSAHRSIRRMILIGPPNRGSIDTVEGLMRGYRVGPFKVVPEILASFETSYQLLPSPDFDWLIDRRGAPVSMDLYDIDTWSKLHVSIFGDEVRKRISSHFGSEQEIQRYMDALETRFRGSLARAKRFQQALSSPLPEDTRLGYFVIGSDCESTPKRAVLENVDGKPEVRFRPKEIADPIGGVDYSRLMLEPGDGRVTRSSLLGSVSAARQTSRQSPLPITNLLFECVPHGEMSSNFEIIHNAIDLLFYGGETRGVDTSADVRLQRAP